MRTALTAALAAMIAATGAVGPAAAGGLTNAIYVREAAIFPTEAMPLHQQAQYRGRGPDRDYWRHRDWHDRRYGRGYYDRRYRDYRDNRRDESAAVAAGFLGFVLGAAIAGSQGERSYAVARLGDPNWIAYCARKYRSFDPRSGTYLGYDGYRRYCR